MRFTITISPTDNSMNLQEDIDRIKEVMGINEGFLNTFLRRRIPAFLDAVVDVADQIYVRGDREYSDDDFLSHHIPTIRFTIQSPVVKPVLLFTFIKGLYDITQEIQLQ